MMLFLVSLNFFISWAPLNTFTLVYDIANSHLPPHVAPLLPIRVEQLVPGPVGEVEGVGPQQEHEEDDQDVLGYKFGLRYTKSVHVQWEEGGCERNFFLFCFVLVGSIKDMFIMYRTSTRHLHAEGSKVWNIDLMTVQV